MDDRIDPFYYKEEFLELEYKIKSKNFNYLSDLTLKITDGTHHTPTYINSGVKFISVKDIYNFKVHFNKTKFISEEEHTRLIKRCHPEANDILLTKIGSVGRVAFVSKEYEKFSLFVSVALIKPNHELINYKYLGYIIASDMVVKQAKRVVKGIGVPDYHLEDIRKLLIPMPTNDIQKNIINIMDNAYKVQEQKEQKSKELLDSIDDYLLEKLDINLPKIEDEKINIISCSDLVNNRIDPYYHKEKFEIYEEVIKQKKYTKLHFIADIKGGKRIPKGNLFSSSITEYKYLRVQNINDDLDINNLNSIAHNIYDILKNYEVNHNNIIISNAGTIGRVAIFKNITNDKVILTENAVKVILKDNSMSNEYLKIILNSKLLQYQMEREYIQTTIPKLSIERIKNLLIPLVDKNTQDMIVEYIKSLNHQSKQLKLEAKEIVEIAKRKVEKIILGDKYE